jgi:hypothetical protein
MSGRAIGAVAPSPPVFFVFGAFGSGKSTLAPLVARELTECLVFDVDWLLEPLSRLARRELMEDPESWPALRNFWLVLASIAGRSGRSTVLFAPEDPSGIESLPARSEVGETRYLLLDCAGAEIERRLDLRDGWRRDWTMDALKDAANFRALGLPAVRTDIVSPERTAAEIVEWVRPQLGVLRGARSFFHISTVWRFLRRRQRREMA